MDVGARRLAPLGAGLASPDLATENWLEASSCSLRFLQGKEKATCVLSNEVRMKRLCEVREIETITNEAVEYVVIICKQRGNMLASVPAINIDCTNRGTSAKIALDFVKAEPRVNVYLPFLR